MNTTELEPHQMPKAIVNWLFAECLNEGDLSVADQLVSPDFTGPAGKGPEGFKAMISPLRHGFPDLRFIIQDMVVGRLARGRALDIARNPSRNVSPV